MEDIIKILIIRLKREHAWRLEDGECSGPEIEESWSMREDSLREEFAEILKADPYGDKINKLFA